MINENQDLNECDKEPIHIPSAIQPHGFFIAIDPNTQKIIAVSKNIDQYFTFSSHAMIHQTLETFSPLLSEWIKSSADDPSFLPHVFALAHTKEHTRFIVTMHPSNPYLILEGEPAQKSDLFPDYLAHSVINESINLSGAKNISELCHQGVLSLQRLSGFGRVMLYQFDEEYNGCVTAEAKIPSMHSYLDHHFPAADIPAQARELYRTNLMRFIPTATYEPIPLQSISPNPIDMSQSTLRSVSPIHLEYLRNMEVGASMSLSIIINGELWGLFACHHPIPISLAPTIRRYCEMFIRLFNAQIEEKIANEASQSFFRLKNRHLALKESFTVLLHQYDLHSAFGNLGPLWLDALESNGVCLLQNDKLSVFGTVPEALKILELSEKITPLRTRNLYSSSALATDLPDFWIPDPIAGVLSLVISQHPYTEIIWFRKEWMQELKWAGDPNKPTLLDPTQRISPRLSFETLVLQQKGKSQSWSNAQLQAAELYKEFGSLIELDYARHSLDRQQRLLIQQGKMAMMGEMISAITHQWSQPLNALSLLISGLSQLIDETDIDHQTLTQIKQTGMAKIHFMSETIDSFRNFFKPDRTLQTFSITQAIQEVSDQLLPQIKLHKINLILEENGEMIAGYPNEFKQVILNLLNNAHDALYGQKIENPWIKCTIGKEQNSIKLHICDNGGGIASNTLEQIFLPYFSTKEHGAGRGIGLYLSRLIIEEHFGGSLSAHNTNEGACFTLTLPKPVP